MLSDYTAVMRQAMCVVFILVSGFFTMKPSRSVRRIFIHMNPKEVSHRGAIVFECNRFIGTTPTYYIFNGDESDRIRRAFNELEQKGHWKQNRVQEHKRKLNNKLRAGELQVKCNLRQGDLYLDFPPV